MKADMSKELKIKKLRMNKPMLYTYTIIGTAFSTSEEKDLPWFFSNFMQIRYSFDWKMLIFDEHINFFDRCPLYKTEYLMFDSEYEKTHDFIETIINKLDEEYYVYLFLDWFYIIPENYKNHLAHTTLISGYDLNRRIFYLSDNYDHGRFVTIEVDFDIVRQAFDMAWKVSPYDFIKSLVLFKYIDGIEVKFNKKDFIRQLKDYICSNPLKPDDEGKKYYYGFQCYQAIEEFIAGNEDIRIEIKDFHLLYEHKYFMQERIKYLLKTGIIKNNALLDKAAVICNDFFTMRNKFIKSKLVSEEKQKIMREEILHKLHESIKSEKTFLYELLNELEQVS